MSSTKNTGSGSAGPSKAGTKGKGKAADRTPKQSNIETKANVRDAIGGIEIEMDGGWMPAVYLDEIRDRVKRDTDAQGSYDHPPAKGTAALDVTAFHAEHQSWGESRDQRPKILFEYKRLGREDPDYEVGIWMDNGRVVLGPDGLPIRNFRDIPKLCSSQMEGFRMEAISRLDSRIAISDFRARMMRDGLPGANAISMRKTRFRNRGRCLAWDRRAGSDFYEVQLRDEMTPDMRNRNSTEELEDLSSAKTEKLQLDTAGTAPARSGKRALPDGVRALRFKTAREKNQKKLEAEAKLKQENTEQKSGSLESTSNTDNDVVSVTKRKRTTESRLVESLQGYLDGLLEEERPSKKQRTHESSSGSPEVLNAKKRKRTMAQEADFDDEAVDEERIFKRNRHYSTPLDLLPSAFSLATPGTSAPLGERAYGATGLADIERSAGPSSLQGVAAGAQGELPGWRGDNPLAFGNFNEVVGDRDMLPISPQEQARVQNALAITRHHYEFVTGLRAPETNRRDSYISQYGFLQLHFDQVWGQTGMENPPVLIGLSWWFSGSLRWNQSTDVFLNSYGAQGRRLFNELENELRGGMLDMFNQHVPRPNMVQDWSSLAPMNDANAAASQPSVINAALPASNPPAAFEPLAELQPAAAFDPLAGVDPSVLSGSFPVEQPLSAFGPSAVHGLQSESASDPFAGFDPSAIWEPSPTLEAQASFMEPLPAPTGPSTMPPAAGAPTAGNMNGLSNSPWASLLQDSDDDFQTWLHSALGEVANAAPLPAQADEDDEQQGAHTFESSYFNDAARLDSSSAQDVRRDGAQDSPLFAQPSLPVDRETVDSDEFYATRLADDFEMFTKGSDFWLS